MALHDEVPNDMLMRARRRLRSPSGSGREMSRQELADAVNRYLWSRYHITSELDATYIGHLEQGRHRWPQARRRDAFREVLGAATDAELGFYINRRARRSRAEEADGDVKRRTLLQQFVAAASPQAASLVATLTAYPNRDSAAGTDSHANVDSLNGRVVKVRAAYQSGRYATAFAQLPGLINELQTVVPGTEPLQRRWQTVTAEAYQVASGLLLKADEAALALVAADRSITAAHASGSPLSIGSSARAVVHTLLASGHPGRAAHLAVTAAQQLERTAGAPSIDSLSLYGALLLRGAIAAARDEDRQLAHDLLDEAATVGRFVGQDGNAHWTAFGPTNVELHQVAVAVCLGDAGEAIDIASHVDLTPIVLAERKAAFVIDVAHAFTQWGKYDKALDAVRTAESYAPEEVRSRRSVHRLIGEIAERGPIRLQRDARAYGVSIGVLL
ncbi:hypothetical protein [Actinoplanes auranticolor]|uniref:hypothetical protein n=1 Tax=Actinoplanes auranticolor TaxID=47988 RepID=UPI001BB42108|nr:hypothetical protein [Actinoplanes auranticolor]